MSARPSKQTLYITAIILPQSLDLFLQSIRLGLQYNVEITKWLTHRQARELSCPGKGRFCPSPKQSMAVRLRFTCSIYIPYSVLRKETSIPAFSLIPPYLRFMKFKTWEVPKLHPPHPKVCNTFSLHTKGMNAKKLLITGALLTKIRWL